MPKTTDSDSGVYCLVIECNTQSKIDCRSFNNIIFPKGYYYYAGSAQKNLSKRIERHIRRDKKIHWHIDYLTAHPDFIIKEVLLFKDKKKSFECLLSKDLNNKFGLITGALNFGNSDCDKCATHLYYSPKRIPYSHFISRYQSIVRLIPSSKNTF